MDNTQEIPVQPNPTFEELLKLAAEIGELEQDETNSQHSIDIKTDIYNTKLSEAIKNAISNTQKLEDFIPLAERFIEYGRITWCKSIDGEKKTLKFIYNGKGTIEKLNEEIFTLITNKFESLINEIPLNPSSCSLIYDCYKKVGKSPELEYLLLLHYQTKTTEPIFKSKIRDILLNDIRLEFMRGNKLLQERLLEVFDIMGMLFFQNEDDFTERIKELISTYIRIMKRLFRQDAQGGYYFCGIFPPIGDENLNSAIRKLKRGDNLNEGEFNALKEYQESEYKIHIVVPTRLFSRIVMRLIELSEGKNIKNKSVDPNYEIPRWKCKSNFGIKDGKDTDLPDFVFYCNVMIDDNTGKEDPDFERNIHSVYNALKDILDDMTPEEKEKLPRYSTHVLSNGKPSGISYAHGGGDWKKYLQRIGKINEFYDPETNFALTKGERPVTVDGSFLTRLKNT